MAAHSGKDRGGNHSYRTILRTMFAKLKYVSAQCMKSHEICIDNIWLPFKESCLLMYERTFAIDQRSKQLPSREAGKISELNAY
jgi:hypothetical protein